MCVYVCVCLCIQQDEKGEYLFSDADAIVLNLCGDRRKVSALLRGEVTHTHTYTYTIADTLPNTQTFSHTHNITHTHTHTPTHTHNIYVTHTHHHTHTYEYLSDLTTLISHTNTAIKAQKYAKPTVIIGVSTLMTWSKARTTTQTLSEENYRQRVCLSRYKHAKRLETLLLSMQSIENVSTFVICPAVVYGQGEDDSCLHPLFKVCVCVYVWVCAYVRFVCEVCVSVWMSVEFMYGHMIAEKLEVRLLALCCGKWR